MPIYCEICDDLKLRARRKFQTRCISYSRRSRSNLPTITTVIDRCWHQKRKSCAQKYYSDLYNISPNQPVNDNYFLFNKNAMNNLQKIVWCCWKLKFLKLIQEKRLSKKNLFEQYYSDLRQLQARRGQKPPLPLFAENWKKLKVITISLLAVFRKSPWLRHEKLYANWGSCSLKSWLLFGSSNYRVIPAAGLTIHNTTE